MLIITDWAGDNNLRVGVGLLAAIHFSAVPDRRPFTSSLAWFFCLTMNIKLA
jgi:hypothetical protein